MISKAINGYVLVRNKYKSHWELPGGFIDASETAESAALREMKEETGYLASETKLIGVMDFFSSDRNQNEFGAVFVSDYDESHEFELNNEIDDLKIWDGEFEFEGELNELDAVILKIFKSKFL